MTVDEIFSKIGAHAIEGMMTHDDLMNYYDFLGLRGMKTLHKYHSYQKMRYQKICRHFVSHHNKLLPYSKVNSDTNVIPETWYKYTRSEVDIGTKKTAVKNGLQMWHNWETSTKQFYEDMYKELCDLEEYTDAKCILKLLKDVEKEIKCVDGLYLNAKAVDYDLAYILGEQEDIHECYEDKLHHIGEKYD